MSISWEEAVRKHYEYYARKARNGTLTAADKPQWQLAQRREEKRTGVQKDSDILVKTKIA